MSVLIQDRVDSAVIADQAVQTLVRGTRGQIYFPGESGYDQARSLWNGMIDKRPALIVQPANVIDIQRAVAVAGEHQLPLSIKGGGHNVAGHAVSEGGLMLDLSRLRGVSVDPERRLARVEGGALWSDFDQEASRYGLGTTTGVVSHTGVAGLTLGGGIGWLVAKHGMTIDNLLAVELVTADGAHLRASQEEHPDLFWALRGGGGNFGVATSFEFQLHPVDTVLAGAIVYPIEQARQVLEGYREFTESAPDEIVVYYGMISDPDSGTPVCAIIPCYAGDLAEGERVIAPLRQLGTPLADLVGPVPFVDFQTAFDPAYPIGRRYYWKSSLHQSLTDPVMDAVVAHGSARPSDDSKIIIEHYHGAFNRVGISETAYPHRDIQYQVVIIGGWDDPATDAAGIQWTRDCFAATEPHGKQAQFLNFSVFDELNGRERVRNGFGPNYPRLVEVKRRYDPANLFRENNNINPAG